MRASEGMELPYLTADLPGTGGTIKTSRADFVVDEVPLYGPSGEGEHLYLLVRKTGLATFEAIRRLAAALKLPEREIGYAGLKDAHAVTTQWLSLRGVAEPSVCDLAVPGVEVLDARRHGNKLRVGHLRGNRFRIVVRGAVADAHERAARILDRLIRRGAPNFFGAQRFGTRGDSHRYGEAILRRDYEGFVRRLLGGPPGGERDPHLLRSRALFDEGRVEEAYRAMPVRHRAEKKCLHALLRFEDFERAYFAVPVRMRQLYASAYQSSLFNRILALRLDRLDAVEEGDLAYLHRNGAVFRVTDAAREQPRCRAFEISASAPMFGARSMLAEGEPGRTEREVLEQTGLTLDSFQVGGGIVLNGIRRPLRLPLREVALVPMEPGVFRVEFFLPRGSFATSVLRELTRAGEVDGDPS